MNRAPLDDLIDELMSDEPERHNRWLLSFGSTWHMVATYPAATSDEVKRKFCAVAAEPDG